MPHRSKILGLSLAATIGVFALGRVVAAGEPPASPPAPAPAPVPAPAPGAAAPGTAASRAPVELPLAAGKSLVGVVESADAKEVVLRIGEDRRRIPWEQLTRLGVFRARAALAAPDDGPARLSLAELAADLGLYVEARQEYERALGLRAIDAASYARAVADAEARAVATALAEVERAADAGDTDGALAALRALQLDFGNAVDPRRVQAALAAVAAKVEARAAEQRALAIEAAKLAEESARKKEILVRMTAARRDRSLGDKAAEDARAQMPKGVVSRVRRLADDADDAYGAARRGLGRLRRLVGRTGPDHDAWAAALDDLDKVQFRLLFDAAKFFWDARVYAPAEDFAARASYIDPVDPRLLELRGDIREHRIRYRASDITNARGTVR
jgi:hypothetical protein